MRSIDLKRFLREVKDRHTLQAARPFCFVLGAGASAQSDIPMGRELVDRWLTVLHEDASPHGVPIEAWASEPTLSIKGFEYGRREEFYGQIYARRFEGAHDTGHADLQGLLSGKEPSFGYSILAYILANTPHKAVITTNFDNLVADALYLYSNTAPILCVHESLAPFITAQLDRPLVVKIHRDLLLKPRNADDEIDELDEAWDAPLRTLFSHFTPIFIGYGGNDGSLMGFLEKLESSVPDRIYWCTRHNSQPNARVMGLLSKRNGTLVTIPGFDETMLALKHALSIPDLLPDLEERHRSRVERYRKQFSELNNVVAQKSRAPDASSDQLVLGAAAAAAVRQLQKEDTPASWILRASTEQNPSRAQALYRGALRRHPNSGDLKTAFGEFLADKKQALNEAEELIKSALDADPDNPDRMYDYGQFLWKHRGDGRRAEPLLRHAVAKRTEILGPEHPAVLKCRNSLANAMAIQSKHAKAEREHRVVLAIRERVLGAEHPDTLISRSNMANQLAARGKDKEAERAYRSVLAVQERVLGAEHPDTLMCRHNLIPLLVARGKHAEAERELRTVLALQERILSAEHPDTLASRANLGAVFAAQKKHADAEREYEAVLAIQKRIYGAEHPDTLRSRINLANARRGQGKYVEAEKEYRAALVVQERVLGSEHSSVFRTHHNLASALHAQKDHKRALEHARVAESGWTKLLGASNRESQKARRLREKIEEALGR